MKKLNRQLIYTPEWSVSMGTEVRQMLPGEKLTMYTEARPDLHLTVDRTGGSYTVILWNGDYHRRYAHYCNFISVVAWIEDFVLLGE